MFITNTGMRTLPDLRTTITAMYTVLKTVVHLIWCSIGGFWTFHCSQQCTLEKGFKFAEQQGEFLAT